MNRSILRSVLEKNYCSCEQNYSGSERNEKGEKVCERCGGQLLYKRDGRNYNIPSPLSSPKEIVGEHNHRPAGTSIRWPALYRHLRQKGMTKRKAAMISNGLWRKKHGLPPKSVPGTKGKVGTNVLPDIRKADMEDNYGRHGFTAYELRKSLREGILKTDPTASASHVDGPIPDFPVPKKKTKKQANPADSDTVYKMSLGGVARGGARIAAAMTPQELSARSKKAAVTRLKNSLGIPKGKSAPPKRKLSDIVPPPPKHNATGFNRKDWPKNYYGSGDSDGRSMENVLNSDSGNSLYYWAFDRSRKMRPGAAAGETRQQWQAKVRNYRKEAEALAEEIARAHYGRKLTWDEKANLKYEVDSILSEAKNDAWND